MSILEMLLQFLLQPLTLILETIYGISLRLKIDYGTAIIPLSLAVNFMLLPFYKRADALQSEERAIQAQMKAGIKHIKSAFKGDERYMMLQAYYRQNHYKPIYSLRSLLPLALEIPFFIAAYRLLSSIEAFNGSPFGSLIDDLGAPDQLLSIGSISINVLPILMTVINVLSSEIYTHGAPVKEKLTLHGMALVFLILLYNSPSALVFYWTLNNLFSLVKNLVSKSPKPTLFRKVAYSILGGVSLLYGSLNPNLFHIAQIVFIISGLLLQIPTLKGIIEWRWGARKPKNTDVTGDTSIFFMCCVLLTLLTGTLIPTATIVSSPMEFMLYSDPHSPLIYVLSASLLASGMFILWLGLFYYLSNPHTRGIFTVGMLAMSGMGIVNYLFFGTNLGTLLPLLQYEQTPSFTATQYTNNIEILLLVALVLIALFLKNRGLVKMVLVASCVTIIVISAYNAIQIQTTIPMAVKTLTQQGDKDKHFVLSTKGKNIIVVMIDRAINGYLPYLFQEKPILRQQFDGFTWYPNTLSYSNSTNTASPSIYGGYDYRPAQMNKRENMLLVDKHNEALKTMPVIFSEHGFEVTVCDPPYANYQWIPDLSIFDDYPKIKKFNTESGQFRKGKDTNADKQHIWKRNFFYFSMMRTAPVLLQPLLYQRGIYFDSKYLVHSDLFQVRDGISKATGQRDEFIDAYSAISAYPTLTEIADSAQNTFIMLSNSTAHNLTLLKEPEYEPELKIDNTVYDTNHKDRFTVEGRTVRVQDEIEMMSYQCNMAAMLKLGMWFDDLRQKGVYDNSRIIIVADHGGWMGSFSDMVFGDAKYIECKYEDAMGFNPLLMVKDFGSTGFNTDYTFMTNADTPTLAFEDVIDKPISPFTGKNINNNAKKEPIHHVFFTTEWKTSVNNKITFLPGVWLTLSSENIFDMSSWKTTSKYEGD